MSTLLCIIGSILALSGGIWLMLIIFTESVLWGLLSLLLPVVGAAFVFMNWEISKHAFLTQVIGIVLLFAGFSIGR